MVHKAIQKTMDKPPGRTARNATHPAARQPAAKKAAPRASKPAAPSEPAPAASKPKHKLVRDSFTIPKTEYAVLEALKLRAAQLARPVKKSELLRAGIAALDAMGDKAFLTALNAVPSLKTGRPSAAKAVAAPSPRGVK